MSDREKERYYQQGEEAILSAMKKEILLYQQGEEEILSAMKKEILSARRRRDIISKEKKRYYKQ